MNTKHIEMSDDIMITAADVVSIQLSTIQTYGDGPPILEFEVTRKNGRALTVRMPRAWTGERFEPIRLSGFRGGKGDIEV